MIEARLSRIALRVAMHRAAHQLLDRSKVLDDSIALAIIGPKAVKNLSASHDYRVFEGDQAGVVVCAIGHGPPSEGRHAAPLLSEL